VNEKLPAQKAAGLYKIHGSKALRFCSGLSVLYFSGQRGHVYFHADSSLKPGGSTMAASPKSERRSRDSTFVAGAHRLKLVNSTNEA